ncbi:MAG: methionyl-tRNA formyltransferase [bacterium]
MIAFFGTPEFAAAHLTGLLDAGLRVDLVVTREDKVRGRGRELSPSPVKMLAARHGIETLTPRRARDAEFVDAMRARGADLFAVVAYGAILPPALLEIPRHGAVNLHASLLPRWRGAAPVQRAIEAGDTVTGVTTMFMNEGVDTGDIILAEQMAIDPNENAGELLARLAPVGSALLAKSARLALDGCAPRRVQEDTLATLAPPLRKSEGRIDWHEPAARIARVVRAMTPWPGARALFRGAIATIAAAAAVPGAGDAGGVAASSVDGLFVGTGDGLLRIDSIQVAGRRRLSGVEFARGARIVPGERFESIPEGAA